MFLSEIARTSTFRRTAAFAGIFAGWTLLLFLFVYIETAAYETARIDSLITQEARIVARESTEQILRAVNSQLATDLHRITYAGLFAADGHRIAGNLARIPSALPADGKARRTDVARLADGMISVEGVRAVAEQLPDGELLIIGRNVDELDHLRQVVGSALGLGVLPAIALSLLAGAILSRRTQSRVKAVHKAVERIMLGDLRERLPIEKADDEFDRLADSVNRMLDEIERLLNDLKGVGDDIAHDLRTPLTRVRTRLERGRRTAQTHVELQEVVDRSIQGLDQALSIITALLRIGELETGLRRAGFGAVNLGAIVEEIVELYAPIADEKRILLEIALNTDSTVKGDRDLIFEAVSNLVDNAIKFTAEGGQVDVRLIEMRRGPGIEVRDNGFGIPPEEREAVFQRFYRSDKSRRIPGNGLGLSLAAAIAKLHGFTITVEDGAPGAVFRLICTEVI
jgi:signal transduction histidine kinase